MLGKTFAVEVNKAKKATPTANAAASDTFKKLAVRNEVIVIEKKRFTYYNQVDNFVKVFYVVR